MRTLGRILAIAGALLAAALAGGAYWIQDANRLKPELEALIADSTEYNVQIKGDIKWQLFPPLQLNIQDLSLQREGEHITAANLDLEMDLSAMWQDMNQWRVTELHLTDATLVSEQQTISLKRLDLHNFQPASQSTEAADFSIDASYQENADDPALAATLEGLVTYWPANDTTGQRLTLRDTSIDAEAVKGVCNADITETLTPTANLPPANDDDLLPLAALFSYNLGADCALSELTLSTETFHDATVDITNVDGQLSILLDVQDFLGGSLVTDIDVDATQQPVAWTVLPEINNVDSQRLLDWTDRRMQWIAPVAFNSSIEMRGNSETELANSVRAHSEFDGGQGQLNIAKIKQQLMRVAAFTVKADEVAAWPDLWDYQQFTGRWDITGTTHELSFVLDNMSVSANGDYDYVSDTIDMLAQVTINKAVEGSPFSINPLLQGTPIPVRCAGAAADPKCRLDQDATKALLARALQRGDESGLRQKLEEKIDEEVPEQYRDAARSLLDILGKSLQRD